MDNSTKKNDLQKRLFDQIKAKLPAQYAIVDAVSDLLKISPDAAYRRLRGDKIMDIEEAAFLCRHFGISVDALLNLSETGSGSASTYFYTPMDLGDAHSYLLYMQNLASRMERLCLVADAEIVSSALDVPFFHFLPYKELTFFKLFAWTNSVYSSTGNFEKFVEKTETKELLDCYRKIVVNHRLIPSREIWTKNTTDTFLKLINYHFEMGHFSDRRVPLTLCEQFLDLLNTLQDWTEKGNKGERGFIPFRLYLCEVDMENSFILLKEAEKANCILKLFTINSLYITDEQFCSETENWLDHLSQRSTLISGASEKERHKFFNTQRQKVRFLIDLISNQ